MRFGGALRVGLTSSENTNGQRDILAAVLGLPHRFVSARRQTDSHGGSSSPAWNVFPRTATHDVDPSLSNFPLTVLLIDSLRNSCRDELWEEGLLLYFVSYVLSKLNGIMRWKKKKKALNPPFIGYGQEISSIVRIEFDSL